jgi:hypothetical protein
MTTLVSRAARVLACLALASTAAACATVTRGTNQAWSVETTPGGAAVSTTNGFQCDSTPCTFRMPRRSEFDVTFTKPGYRTVTTHVTTQVSGAGAAGMAGNVIVGGIIGGVVDVASGAMLEIRPNPLQVTLEAEGAAPAEAQAPAAAAP